MDRSMPRADAMPFAIAWLAREGYTILRFSNRDVLTARESVLATIAATCGLPW